MATVTRTHVFVDGDTLTAAQLNTEFNNLLNAPAIVNADISAGAAIAASKIANTAVTLSDNQTISGTNTFSGGNTFSVAQTFSGANIFNAEHIMKQIATPANPSAGNDKLYFKSDDKLYRLNSSGTETTVGQTVTLYTASGSGGNTTSTSYVDVTNSSITITTTATANILMSASVQWQINASGGTQNASFQMVRGVTAIGQAMTYDCPGNTFQSAGSVQTVDAALAAGTYTYKLQMKTSGATLTVGAVAVTLTVVQ